MSWYFIEVCGRLRADVAWRSDLLDTPLWCMMACRHSAVAGCSSFLHASSFAHSYYSKLRDIELLCLAPTVNEMPVRCCDAVRSGSSISIAFLWSNS